MSKSQNPEFGPIRSFLWPIHRYELRKLMPMMLMLALICFNYTILRNMKDSIVVTASGAEVIPFIKVWVLLPMAVLLTFIFTKLSNRYSQERVFYIMIGGFLSFFLLFAFILYPLRDTLHLDTASFGMAKYLPIGFKGLVSMCCNWSFTIFYVMCELWGNIILSVLFWGFANEVTKINEASRFYGVFGVGANIATIIAGQVAIYFSQGIYNPSIPFGTDAWEQIMMLLILIVVGSGITAIATFRWLNLNVLTEPCFDEFHHNKKELKKKEKLSMRESFSYLSNSKYLICIATIVVAYNLVINLVEVVWKDQLARLYPSPSEYNTYMNNLSSAIGFVATIAALFMSRIINKLGWTGTALITPILMFITCLGFFLFLFFQDNWAAPFMMIAGTSPLAIAVFFGAAQNCLSKAAKYSVFDATKEMTFIPLSHECKLKGKAAIDGIGSRLGKSGGSLIHQGLLMFFGTVLASANYAAVILLVAIILWMIATKSLGQQFNNLINTDTRQDTKEHQGVAENQWEGASVSKQSVVPA